MAKQEDGDLNVIDNVSACCSAIRECVMFIAERHRYDLVPADADELERILTLTRDIQTYQAALRESISAAYQEGRRNGHASKDGTRSHEPLRLVASGED